MPAMVVAMTVVAMMVIMIVMIVVVMVPLRRPLAVGAALGVERALHAAHLGTEALGHVGDDVVLADVDDARTDLGSEVAVAEVPGDAGERVRVSACDLQQPLRRGLDGYDTAVLQLEASPAERTGALVRSSRKLRPPAPVSAMRRRMRWS